MKKVRDFLLQDFINECYENFELSEVDFIMNEDIDENLLHSKTLRPGDSFSFYSLPLYTICRIIKPSIVIETGTQNGGSAQTILYVLHKNKKGVLHSIDSGSNSTDGTHIITSGKPGEKISDFLKERWILHVGFSYDILPTLLEEVKNVDLFFHDSDHSKNCVEFEFKKIIEYIGPNSLIGLHDHYDQWDHRVILKNFNQVLAKNRPNVHFSNGDYHNVLRLWKKN